MTLLSLLAGSYLWARSRANRTMTEHLEPASVRTDPHTDRLDRVFLRERRWWCADRTLHSSLGTFYLSFKFAEKLVQTQSASRFLYFMHNISTRKLNWCGIWTSSGVRGLLRFHGDNTQAVVSMVKWSKVFFTYLNVVALCCFIAPLHDFTAKYKVIIIIYDVYSEFNYQTVHKVV